MTTFVRTEKVIAVGRRNGR